MPSVEYDLGDLASLLGRAYTEEELSDKIPMMGAEVDGIEDGKISLEVFPNRPDMLNVEGFARALKGFLGVEGGLKSYDVAESDIVLNIDPSVDDIRPAVATGIISGIELDDYTVKSVMDMQEKLHTTHGRNRMKVAIGVHDLSAIKPPITYKAVAPKDISFVPLDMDVPLDLGMILRKHPKGKDYAWCLEGKDRYPVFVDSKGDVLSFPPIINGELTRLTERSRDLFIEMTGTDQKAVTQALTIICSALADRGGRIESVKVNRL